VPDQLDELLDSALATYAEPRTGLEQRILARVEQARFSRGTPWRRWLGWGLAATLAASLLLYFEVSGGWHRRMNAEQTAPRQEQAASPRVPDASQESIRSLPSRAPKWASAPIRHRSTWGEMTVATTPKLDVFPAPQALSAQEQALVELVAQPPDVQRQILEKTRQNEAPLSIAAIQIPPIPPPDEGQK